MARRSCCPSSRPTRRRSAAFLDAAYVAVSQSPSLGDYWRLRSADAATRLIGRFNSSSTCAIAVGCKPTCSIGVPLCVLSVCCVVVSCRCRRFADCVCGGQRAPSGSDRRGAGGRADRRQRVADVAADGRSPAVPQHQRLHLRPRQRCDGRCRWRRRPLLAVRCALQRLRRWRRQRDVVVCHARREGWSICRGCTVKVCPLRRASCRMAASATTPSCSSRLPCSPPPSSPPF